MSILCDHCKQEGSNEDPIFFIESFLKGVPLLESCRDLSLLEQPQMNPWEPLTTPCTLQLHSNCARQLQSVITQLIQDYILPPEEKPSGNKKKAKRRSRKADKS